MSNKKIRRFLVTGGSGFVGKNLKDLTDHFYDTPDDYVYVDKEQCDLLSFEKTKKCLEQYKPDVVLHLAGMVGGVKKNTENQYEMLRTNGLMSINIVEACLKTGVETLVSTLSTCIYPFNNKSSLSKPLTEDYLRLGFEESNYGYALAKSVLYEQTLNARKMGHDYKCIVPTNLYGPMNHRGENAHMVMAILEKIKNAIDNKKSFIEIWGSPDTVRQHLFVEDFCEILLTLVDKDFDVVNVCATNSAKTVDDHVQTMLRVAGVPMMGTSYTGKFPGINKKIVSNDFLLKLLGKYEFTSFEDGCRVIWKEEFEK